MGSQTEVNVERPPKTAQALSIDCSRQAERAERLSAYITPQPCADCRCMRKTTYAACVAWLIHFPEVGKQSNGCGQSIVVVDVGGPRFAERPSRSINRPGDKSSRNRNQPLPRIRLVEGRH
jgi:hypothetical protein